MQKIEQHRHAEYSSHPFCPFTGTHRCHLPTGTRTIVRRCGKLLYSLRPHRAWRDPPKRPAGDLSGEQPGSEPHSPTHRTGRGEDGTDNRPVHRERIPDGEHQSGVSFSRPSQAA